MATKPKEVPCEEVIDCIDELLVWLVSRNLATPKVSALKASFDVLARYPDEDRLENVVACCLYELETFLVAAQRRDPEIQGPRLKPLSAEDRSLLYDDGPRWKPTRRFERSTPSSRTWSD